MNLLERYLQAIGQYLPNTTRDDVLNELRANLLEQIEAREEELARPLNDTEFADLLKAHGRPEAVALRYLPQHSLIGPSIFPFYVLALRRALPFFLLVYAIAAAATAIWTPGVPTAGTALRAALEFIPNLFLFWAIVTLVFVVIEIVHTRNRSQWEAWEPSKLPPLKTPDESKPKSFASRLTDLSFQILWMLYVLAIPSHPFLILGPGHWYLRQFNVTYAPIWHTAYILYIALLLVQLILKISAFLPGRHAWFAPVEFVQKLFGVAILAFLVSTSAYFLPASATADIHSIDLVNHWTGVAYRICLFFAVLDLLQQLWRYIRPRIHSTRLAF